MIERICPECRTSNALDANTCHECGASMEQPMAQHPTTALVQRSTTALAHLQDAVPARWQRVGKAAALGAVALAVEVGAAWLQQRGSSRSTALVRTTTTPPKMRRYVARQRVWENYEGGTLTRRVVEQTVWHLPEE
jgi:hypothetical protein